MSEILSPDTTIEVIATKNGKHYKQVMTMEKWQSFEKKPGFTYQTFQAGFSQFKTEN